jgi:ATP-dependent protease ClpP protease subunit
MSNFYVVGEINPAMATSFFRGAAGRFITDVVISSPGGDVGLTFGMFDVIKYQHIYTHVVGLAQSAAGVLLQAGTWRTMTNSSLLMFHRPEENVSDQEFRLFTQLVEAVAQRISMPFIEAVGLFDNKFINANRALELGLIDEIAEDVKVMRWIDGESNRDRQSEKPSEQLRYPLREGSTSESEARPEDPA